MQKRELISLLNSKKTAFLELSNACGGSVLVTPALGGRILGVFIGDRNCLWVNNHIGADWNAGGHRTWIAPEWQDKSLFLKPDRSTWFVNSCLDPASYRVVRHEPGRLVEMASDIDIAAVDGTGYRLGITRKISLGQSNHVHGRCSFACGDSATDCVLVSFAHCLKNRGVSALQQELGLWSIAQVRPPGLILIPLSSGMDKSFYEYYDPFPVERLQTFEGGAAIFVDGAKRYKLGFPPSHTRGSIGYIAPFSPGKYLLIIKFFFNDPDGCYVDKPIGDERKNGDVIQLYNHFEKGPMAFAELECHAPAITIVPGDEQLFNIDILFAAGEKNKIVDRAAELLFPGRASELITACDTYLS